MVMKITKKKIFKVFSNRNKFVLMFYLIMFFFVESNYCQIVNGSFETEDGQFSTNGWRNWGGIPCSDTPPSGGNWSLELRSGCVWVYCSQYIPEAKNGDIYEINCWAKITSPNGGGELFWSNNQWIEIFISDTVWTQFYLIDTLEITYEQDSIFFFLTGGGGFAGMGGACYDLVVVNKIGNTTSINNNERSLKKFELYQNYPNPFNPKTVIKFTLPEPHYVKLEIYNSHGQKISTLLNNKLQSGMHQVEFNGRNLASGIYFYKLDVGNFQKTRKMLLIK